MASVTDTTGFSLSNSASGVLIDADVNVELGLSGGFYTYLYLQYIDFNIERSTDGTNYSVVYTERITTPNSYVYSGNHQYTDTSVSSGTTYYYRIRNDIQYREEEGAPP